MEDEFDEFVDHAYDMERYSYLLMNRRESVADEKDDFVDSAKINEDEEKVQDLTDAKAARLEPSEVSLEDVKEAVEGRSYTVRLKPGDTVKIVCEDTPDDDDDDDDEDEVDAALEDDDDDDEDDDDDIVDLDVIAENLPMSVLEDALRKKSKG